jgi:hypothetical protein
MDWIFCLFNITGSSAVNYFVAVKLTIEKLSTLKILQTVAGVLNFIT